jgi:hypothetical protein
LDVIVVILSVCYVDHLLCHKFFRVKPIWFFDEKEKGKLAKIKRNDKELTRLLVKTQPNALGMI